jgi:hypothetical protein
VAFVFRFDRPEAAIGGRERTAGSGVCLSKVSSRLRLSWGLPWSRLVGRPESRRTTDSVVAIQKCGHVSGRPWPRHPVGRLAQRLPSSWVPSAASRSRTIVALALDDRTRTWERIGLLLPHTFGREAGCSGSAVLIRTGTTGSVVPVCRPALRSTSPRCGVACRPGGADSPGPGGPSIARVRLPFLRFCAPSMPWAISCSRRGSHSAGDLRPRRRPGPHDRSRGTRDRDRRSPPPTVPLRAAPETGAVRSRRHSFARRACSIPTASLGSAPSEVCSHPEPDTSRLALPFFPFGHPGLALAFHPLRRPGPSTKLRLDERSRSRGLRELRRHPCERRPSAASKHA